MPIGGSKIPTPKSVPPPSYQETVAENMKIEQKRQLSLQRAILAQSKSGANQLKSSGSGLRLGY